jgi:predicted metal-dependent peptidase
MVFHPTFVTSLTDQELRFLILHEAVHAAAKHLTMWRRLWERDRRLTNIAADYFVNGALVDMDKGEGFIKMPSVGIQPDPKYRGWNVEQIFNDLLNNPSKAKGKGQGSGDGAGDGETMDSHDWEAAQEVPKEVQEARAQEIDRALRQGEMLAKKMGKGAGNSDGVIGELLKPKVDWREQLREFVQQQCAGRDESTWRRPNRRYLGDNVYMPSSISESVGPLVIGFDTSGSCFDSGTVTRFVSELQAIVDTVSPEGVWVLYCDATVQGATHFPDGVISIANITPKGGGGTDLTRMFDWVHSNHVPVQAMIIFTDGETPYGPPPPYPVLWAMTGRTQAPFGTNIFIG